MGRAIVVDRSPQWAGDRRRSAGRSLLVNRLRLGPGILSEMKKALAIPAVFVIAVLVYMIRSHADYGEALPPGFPSDIPVVAGEILSGRRTLFEDGRGYVVDVRTDLPYREVVAFYADRYGEDGLRDAHLPETAPIQALGV